MIWSSGSDLHDLHKKTFYIVLINTRQFWWCFYTNDLLTSQASCHCQQQKSYSGLPSPGRSNSIYFWNDSWVQTFHKGIINKRLDRMPHLSHAFPQILNISVCSGYFMARYALLQFFKDGGKRSKGKIHSSLGLPIYAFTICIPQSCTSHLSLVLTHRIQSS